MSKYKLFKKNLLQQLHVSNNTLSYWLNGSRNASYKNAKALAKIIGGKAEIWQDPESVAKRQELFKTWLNNQREILIKSKRLKSLLK